MCFPTAVRPCEKKPPIWIANESFCSRKGMLQTNSIFLISKISCRVEGLKGHTVHHVDRKTTICCKNFSALWQSFRFLASASIDLTKIRVIYRDLVPDPAEASANFTEVGDGLTVGLEFVLSGRCIL